MRRHGIAPPYVAFSGTIEPRKDVPTLRARLRRVSLALIRTSGSWSRAATAGAPRRRAPRSRRAASRPVSCVPGTSRTTRSSRSSGARGRRLPVARRGIRPARARGARVRRGPRHDLAARRSRRSSATRRSSCPRRRRCARPCACEQVLDDGRWPHDCARPVRHGRPSSPGTEPSPATSMRYRSRHRDERATRVKALVTGASGFVGPHLFAHLRARGDDVVDPGDERAGFDITDRDAVGDALRPRIGPTSCTTSRPDRTSATSWRDPTRLLARERRGHRNTCSTPRARPACNASSSSGAPRSTAASILATVRLREDAPLRPITPYGASKVAASYVALQAWLGAGLETIRARAFSHTGPGQLDTFLVPGARPAHRRGRARRRRRPSPSAPSTRCATSTTCATSCAPTGCSCERGEPGEVYNVCSGTGVTVARDRRTARRRGRSARYASRSTPRWCGRSTCPCSSATAPSSRRHRLGARALARRHARRRARRSPRPLTQRSGQGS